MSPSFSLERQWWGFSSELTQGSMLSVHTWWESLEKGCSHSLCDVLWKELGYPACPPTAIVLIWMTLSVPWSYRLPLISGSELYIYFFIFYLIFLKNIFSYYFLKNFPTSKIVICLPYCFTPTHHHNQGQGKTCFNTLCVELLGHCLSWGWAHTWFFRGRGQHTWARRLMHAEGLSCPTGQTCSSPSYIHHSSLPLIFLCCFSFLCLCLSCKNLLEIKLCALLI